MIIGIPKEIKDNEYRVGITPSGVKELVSIGHNVLIETKAGVGTGISDEDYIGAGAQISPGPQELFAKSDLIVKVKEPLPEEYPLFKSGQILFTFLHLAPNPTLTRVLLEKNLIAIGYETIKKPDKSLPLLIPMSEIAGKLSVQIGAHYLQKNEGGRGVLLGGVPGVAKGEVTILGGGTVGMNAARIALGMGAIVRVLDTNPAALKNLENILGNNVITLFSNKYNIEKAVLESDLVVGAVLLPEGMQAPHIVERDLISHMRKGAVIVDVAIDQGGCIQTSRPTTHSEPVYDVDGVIHYCVCNIPGIVARSSTFALTDLSLPYIKKIAGMGIREAVSTDSSLAAGVNIYYDKVTCLGAAKTAGLTYHSLSSLL